MGRGRGLTLVEVVVILAAIAVLIAFFLPSIRLVHPTSRNMQNGTQIRSIEQGYIIFSQGNNTYFPGLTSKGGLAPPLIQVPGEKYGAAQSLPSLSLALLLEGHYVVPQYLVSPGEKEEKNKIIKLLEKPGFVTSSNFSYSISRAANPIDDAGRKAEWMDNTNTRAAIVSDRVLNRGAEVHTGAGAAPEVQRSIWTTFDGDWRGSIVFGDNSTQFLTTSTVKSTRYGKVTNADDNLFTANGPDDAFQYRD